MTHPHRSSCSSPTNTVSSSASSSSDDDESSRSSQQPGRQRRNHSSSRSLLLLHQAFDYDYLRSSISSSSQPPLPNPMSTVDIVSAALDIVDSIDNRFAAATAADGSSDTTAGTTTCRDGRGRGRNSRHRSRSRSRSSRRSHQNPDEQ
eukprot:CAMPEP_0113463892 /NCGR_PEP_ID=MMETSP0014_2-20120614/12906_1 /TAXON_ID=2857 /ORGANISM="Nitzschia sp." /LENGTH=147 /DNA_ID=CAMNT_0000355929 /DNA_START=91 /DNA_END=534 /DNA_ORIENTATION=- /assembly_acc=CAM_ASM_000159